jgi:hypothetical protein
MIDIDGVHSVRGGSDATMSEYPFTVYIEGIDPEGGDLQCSGVLFAANLVITNGNLFHDIYL